MPTYVLISVCVIAVALAYLVWAVVVGPDRSRQRVAANLQRGLVLHAGSDVMARERRPASAQRVARKVALPGSAARLERLYSRAGRPIAWPVDRLLAIKPLLALTALAMTALLRTASDHPLVLILGLGATFICYFVPELLLYSRGIERSEQITLEVADTLDQMTIAVEAGLGFDSAMARAAKNGTGPLAEELSRTLQDIQMGLSRRQAFESLSRRTDVAELRRFVRAVIQADNYGISIADVLRTQAAEMRVKRRQRAEEKAMQIPVKVIFPLMLCILPVLFIVLLGPVAIQLVGMMG